VAICVAEDHQAALAPRDPELCSLYPSKGLESRADRPAAVRAMTIRRVQEFIGHAVPHVAA
jgi:hypothetical protein